MNKILIDRAKTKALSGEEILNMLHNKTNLMLYRDLYKYDNLKDVLGPHKACVILYETREPLYGHWCVIFEQNPDTIEFMDSYGYLIDNEISPDFMSADILKRFYNGPKLRRLIYDSRYKYIVYNDHPLQERKFGINTCGRWVVTRLLFRNMPLDKFVKYLYSFKMNLDDIVTIITEML